MKPKEYTDWLKAYLYGLEYKNGIGKVHTDIIREKLQTVFVKITPVNPPVYNLESFKKAVAENIFGDNIPNSIPNSITKAGDGRTYSC